MAFTLYKGLYQSDLVPSGAAGIAIEANWVTIADTLDGLGSLANQDAHAVAISGGAIDGTAIGGATPAAGAFTTLASQEHSIPSDTVGLKLGSRGEGTIISDGVNINCGLPIKPRGYVAPNGWPGWSGELEIAAHNPAYYYRLTFSAGLLTQVTLVANLP